LVRRMAVNKSTQVMLFCGWKLSHHPGQSAHLSN